MTDSLRDRIAAAATEAVRADLSAPIPLPYSVIGMHVADAVIAALGLRLDSTCHVHDREKKRRCTRYVTDWENE